MYKNFNLTEEEKKQIMKMHKSHGYKKPINEEEEYDGQESESDEISIDPLVFFNLNKFKVALNTNEDDETMIEISLDEDGYIGNIEVDFMMSDKYSEEQLIGFVRKMANEGHFNDVPSYMSFDIEKRKPFDFN
jgi:hypothetical protein